MTLFFTSTPSLAQVLADVPDGRALTYLVTDPLTGEELLRYRVWRGFDKHQPVLWREDRSSDGSHSLTECFERNGRQQPVTGWRQVSFGKTGKLTASVFQIADPTMYPLLSRPLPASGLEPFACFKGSLLDKAAIERGEEASTHLWLSDNFYLNLIFKPEEHERIQVPDGSFDSIKIKVTVDSLSLFPRIPSFLAPLLSAIAGPSITLWISSGPTHQLLRLELRGISIRGYQNSVAELLLSEDAPTVPPEQFEFLDVASELPPEPALVTMNTGNVSLGNATARVSMKEAHTSEGELMIVRAAFSRSLIVEARAVENFSVMMPTRFIEQRIYDSEGALVERAAAYLNREGQNLYSDVYPNSMVLALILPRLFENDRAHFHVVGFSQTAVSFGRTEHEVEMWRRGLSTVNVGGLPVQAIHMKLRPLVNVPSYLRPIVKLGTPTFDLYLGTNPPHRMLEFDGAFGLLGSSEIHVLADPLPQN